MKWEVLFPLTETLHKKKREAMQLSSSINDIKRKIDEVCVCTCLLNVLLSTLKSFGCAYGWQVRNYLESCRREHDQRGGPLTTDGGEVIMEEPEYHAITELKQVHVHVYVYPQCTHYTSHCIHMVCSDLPHTTSGSG